MLTKCDVRLIVDGDWVMLVFRSTMMKIIKTYNFICKLLNYQKLAANLWF
jgi:hypothetical protein